MQCKIKKTKQTKKTHHTKRREKATHTGIKESQWQILLICTNGLMSWFIGARYGVGKPMEMSVNVQ